ncbi:MAG: hypothetical protein Q4F97_01065 [Bacteroidales bacterium]|nr:hypothetical protein [Bacteroidales bacterium]
MLTKRKILTGIRYLGKKVKNFLSKAQSKELLTFLFFLCLSFLFWMLQSMNEEGEATFVIPVEYNNIPKNIIFTNKPADKLNIRVKDKGLVLLNYSIKNLLTPIDIDFNQLTKKNGVVNLDDDMLRALSKKKFKPTTSILTIYPDTISIYFSEQKSKKVPIVFNGTIDVAPQSRISDRILFTPDSVNVFAPQHLLDSINDIKTERLIYTNLADSVNKNVALQQVYGTKIVPTQVNMVIPIDEFTEKYFNIPIKVVDVPKELTIRLFPTNVKLLCFVGLNDFKDISAESFQLGVSYEVIKSTKNNKVAVDILKAPINVFNIRLQPDSVEFIIEEKVELESIE